MFAFTVWMSVVPPIPLLFLSMLTEGGPTGLLGALTHLSWTSVFALFFLAIVGTLYSLGTWGMLMSLYPAAVVAPFSLMSPIFGMLGGWLILNEHYDAASVIASCLIVFALTVNTYASRIRQRTFRNRQSAESTLES